MGIHHELGDSVLHKHHSMSSFTSFAHREGQKDLRQFANGIQVKKAARQIAGVIQLKEACRQIICHCTTAAQIMLRTMLC